jgi:flagellar hook-associated protein 2
VNGIQISSASNTVTGAIPGVTLNLASASPSTTVDLTIAPNTSQASAAINQFVSDYNALIKDVNAQYTYTAGSGEGVLAQDPTVQTLQSDLLGVLNYTAVPASGTTTVSNLS